MEIWQTFPIIIVIFLGIIIGIGYLTGVNVPNEWKQGCTFPSYVCNAFDKIGMPSGLLNSQLIIWYCILPLLGIAFVVYGFLDTIRIFNSKFINGALSVIVAAVTIPLGLFLVIVSTLFAMMGVYAVGAFVLLFFVGVGFVASGLLRGWKAGAIEQRLFDEEIRSNINQIRTYKKRIELCKREIRELENKVDKKEIDSNMARRKISELEEEKEAWKRKCNMLEEDNKQLKGHKKQSKKESKIRKESI